MAEAPNAAVEIALNTAMDVVREAMRPWEPAPATGGGKAPLEQLRDDFREDFKNLIAEATSSTKSGAFDDVMTIIKRLFRYVGTAAAMIAEAQEKGVSEATIPVGYEILAQACKLVEIAICPRPEELRFRACRLTPILGGKVGRDAHDELRALVIERYRAYIASQKRY